MDPVRVVSRECLTTPLLTQNARSWSPRRWPLDRFDTYETFRDLSAGLYDIDTRQYARDDAPGVLIDGQAKLRGLVDLPRNWPDDPTWRAEQAN